MVLCRRILLLESTRPTVHARASAQHEPGVARFIFSFVCSVSWRILTLLIFLRYFRQRSALPVFRACAFLGTATTPELEHEEAPKAMCEEPELQQQGRESQSCCSTKMRRHGLQQDARRSRSRREPEPEPELQQQGLGESGTRTIMPRCRDIPSSHSALPERCACFRLLICTCLISYYALAMIVILRCSC